MNYQVNYECVMLEGSSAGKRYHRHELFNSKSDAIFYAKRDGLSITPTPGNDPLYAALFGSGAYRQEDSVIIDLERFNELSPAGF